MKRHIWITRIVMFSILFMFLVNVKPVVVSGESMQPSLYNNQILLCNTLDKNFEVGDIVVIKPLVSFGGEYVIKRIARIEGEQIWIEGDNKEFSYDSRNVGYIHVSNILGTCFII